MNIIEWIKERIVANRESETYFFEQNDKTAAYYRGMAEAFEECLQALESQK